METYLSQRGRIDPCHRQFVALFKDSTTILNQRCFWPLLFIQLPFHNFTNKVLTHLVKSSF